MIEPIKYDPLMLCSCGTSVHQGDAMPAHEARWHSETVPAVWTLVSAQAHAQAGWGVEGYPEYVTC